MKFYCDSCNTKYGIADEKVRGKVLKVRCKKCGNVITVREQSVPSQQQAAPAPPPTPSQPALDPSAVEWHYSINGQSYGPFAFGALEQRFASGELGDECYVWTDSFSSWKPVRKVDAFKSALEKGQRIKPRRNTIGVSQALEAIKPEELEKAKKLRMAKESQQPEAPEKTEPASVKADEVEDDGQADEGQKDRLAKLRARLNSSKTPEDAGPEPVADDLMADGGTEQASSSDTDEPSDDGPDALGPTLPLDDAGRSDIPAAADDDGENSGLFEDFDAPEQSLPDHDSPEESDQIPFLAGGPELGSESDKVGDKPKNEESEGITGSLLIQLDSIQKQGRGKKALLVTAALLVIGGLTVTAIYLAGQVEPEKNVVAKDGAAGADEDDELVIRTYSKDEQNKIMMLDGQKAGKNEGKKRADKEKEPTRVASNQKADTSKKRVRGPKIKDDGASLEDALKSAKKKGADSDKFRKGLDDGAVSKTELDSPLAGNSDAFNSLGALATDRKDSIYNPTDAVKKRKKSTGGAMKLSRKQINEGIRTVRRSVGICRQRHSRRGAPLDARKIYLTLTVEPGGRVSKFGLAPDRVRHTEFDRCMQSHRGRWKFPSFDGSAQTMRAPFVLQ